MRPVVRYHVLRISTRVMRISRNASIRMAQVPVAIGSPVVAAGVPARCNVVVVAEVNCVVGVDRRPAIPVAIPIVVTVIGMSMIAVVIDVQTV